MRKLTYKSFLKKYVKDLTYNDTLHLNQLLNEAENSNPRLREILLLYMLENDRLEALKSSENAHPSIYKLLKDYKKDLINESYKVDQESPFYKIFHSYKVKRDYKQNRSNFKTKLIKKINQIKEEKSISNYRIYTELNLNPGNVNYALKHIDPLKLSETNLKDIRNFVETY